MYMRLKCWVCTVQVRLKKCITDLVTLNYIILHVKSNFPIIFYCTFYDKYYYVDIKEHVHFHMTHISHIPQTLQISTILL